MSFQRKIERNQLKKQWKEHNKGVSKKYRSDFRGFWKWFQKNKKKYKPAKIKRPKWISFRKKGGRK